MTTAMTSAPASTTIHSIVLRRRCALRRARGHPRCRLRALVGFVGRSVRRSVPQPDRRPEALGRSVGRSDRRIVEGGQLFGHDEPRVADALSVPVARSGRVVARQTRVGRRRAAQCASVGSPRTSTSLRAWSELQQQALEPRSARDRQRDAEPSCTGRFGRHRRHTTPPPSRPRVRGRARPADRRCSPRTTPAQAARREARTWRRARPRQGCGRLGTGALRHAGDRTRPRTTVPARRGPGTGSISRSVCWSRECV